MARTYKRSSNGRFAGGAGRSNGKAPAGQRRVIAKNGSKGVAAGKIAPRKTSKAKAAAKSVGRFALKHPRMVIGAGLIGAANVGANVHAVKRHGKLIDAAATAVRNAVSDKRGIGQHRPGAGLKKSKRTVRGAYKIRSK